MSARPLLVALRPLGLGDLLTALPALRALRAAFPEHRLVLAAPEALAPLAFLSGAIDELVATAPLRELDRRLRGADVAVNLHGRGPHSHAVLVAARPRRLIAFAHPDVPASAHMPAWREEEHEVDRWCRLLSASGIPADRRALGLDARALPAPLAGRDATIVHPGAASEARRWPPERYAAVARAELERGRDVVVTGSGAETWLARAVAREAGLPPSAVVAGSTSLLELAALVASAGRVVCGDTGVAHLATAFGTPSVVLFGPTPPSRWGPPARGGRHRALWAGSEGDPHGPVPDAGLLRVGVADVVAALARLDLVEEAA